VTDIRQVAFTGAVYLAEPDETVDLAGNLHLVTRLSGSEHTGWTVDWRANLDTTTATGQSTATHYVGSGADAGTVALPPGPPVRTAVLSPLFTLLPPGPPMHPPSPIRLGVHVAYDETGRVTDVGVHIEQTYGPID
jgi:hypothetical protein